MKILHINDVAGVAGVLCKYLRKAGHQADLISWMDDQEFGFCEFYGGRHFKDQKIMLYFLKGLIPKYDIIHVHFSFQFLDWLYTFNKPIVMHYHGTELALNAMDARMMDFRCKAILVSGEVLLQYHDRAKVLPTIVDTDHFKPMPELRESGTLVFDIPYLDITEFKDNKQARNITVIDRATNTIKYADLPKTLNRFGGYIDVRYHKQRGLIPDASKTALEALACGLKVLNHKGEWVTELPEKHKPENVVNQLVKYYEAAIA